VRANLLIGVLLASSLSANASVSCPGIFQRQVNEDTKNTYYVLTFLGDLATVPAEAALRRAKLGRIETIVTPKMQDYVNKLSKRASASGPSIVLITCDFPMGAADLNRADMDDLSRRNVLATLWGGNEGDKLSVVYVSLPLYQLRMGNRRDMEVAWLRAAVTTDELDDWMRELGRDSIAQQALLALGVSLVAIKQGDWQFAKYSLCQVRSNLKLMAQEAVRPAPEELEQEIQKLLKQAMIKADQGASAAGLDLNAVQSIKLACSV